jgi:5-methyltetrahydrofolate--homocysteine methyltransferase
MTAVLTAPNGNLHIGTGLPTALINDQLRVMDQSHAILDQLSTGQLDGLLNLARWGQNVGTDMVDVLIMHPELDEVNLLPRVTAVLKKEIGCPISLDSRHPEALEAALEELRPFKGMINSVTAEKEVLEKILPVAKKYGAAVVGMPSGLLHNLPISALERLAGARRIVEACEGIGIPREDVILDAICLPGSAFPGSFHATMETLEIFHRELGVSTILGIGNAGYGMPEPTVIDLAYLAAAIARGLDAALVNPTTRGLIETVRAMDFLAGKDTTARRYIQNFRQKKQVYG